MTLIEKAKALKDAIQKALKGEVTHDVVIGITTELCDTWVAGITLPKNAIVVYNGVKYLCPNGVTTQAHFTPDAKGLESVYMPYTDESKKEWIYNEYVMQGWQRTYEGNTYTANSTLVGNNLWTPNLVPAVWTKE